jgi:hypothetical protein
MGKRLVGWTMIHEGLTFITVKGAGHRPPIPGSIARKPFSSTGQALPSQQETATCCLLNLMIQCVSKIVSLCSDKISNRKGKYLSFEFYHLYFLMYI